MSISLFNDYISVQWVYPCSMSISLFTEYIPVHWVYPCSMSISISTVVKRLSAFLLRRIKYYCNIYRQIFVKTRTFHRVSGFLVENLGKVFQARPYENIRYNPANILLKTITSIEALFLRRIFDLTAALLCKARIIIYNRHRQIWYFTYRYD